MTLTSLLQDIRGIGRLPEWLADAANARDQRLPDRLEPSECPFKLRSELTDVIDKARRLTGDYAETDGKLLGGVSDGSPPAFSEHLVSVNVELGDVAGVTSSKSGRLFAEIEPNADYAYLSGVYRCSTPKALLDSGFRDGFRDARMANPTLIPAVRFGAAGPLYFCNIDGSHRITAARAEFRRLAQPRPLTMDARSIEPMPEVIQLLEKQDVIVAAMAPTAIDAAFSTAAVLRYRLLVAGVYSSSSIVAVVRRDTQPAAILDDLALAGRIFSLRRFLTQNGCTL